jgi:Rrf2 family cysteine metabolism transcriptional repressor
MIKISKRAQYGLRAMTYLAKNYKAKNICSVKLISKAEAIPFEFLEKIISQLEKEKLVEGKKGVLGGYVLSKSPKKISTNDIVSILEDNKKPVDCSLCGRKSQCLTKNVWLKVEIALNKTLKSITLQDLIS